MNLTINWAKWILWMLPNEVRNGWTWSWIKALISPIIALNSYLILFQIAKEKDIRTNGQVRKLRQRLNDEIDPSLQRIEIHDVLQEDYIFAYLAIENKPVYLPQFLTAGDGYDFEVWIPVHYMNQIDFITSLLDRYKLPTKKYYIIWI